MKRLLTATVAMVALMISCTGNKQAERVDEDAVMAADTVATDTLVADTMEMLIESTPMPRAADELFDDFLFNFIANRKLQMERVAFPLMVSHVQGIDTIQRRDWRMEQFFMHQGYYTLIFDNEEQMELVKDTAVSHAVVERVYFGSDVVRQFVFNRMNGMWMLCSVDEQRLQDNANASFLRFYQRFSVDTTFQVASLHDPVTFIGPDPDDDFGQVEGVITAETWPAFASELPSGIIYNINYGQTYSAPNHKVFVIRGISNGLEVEMTFTRRNGQWKLTKLCT